MKKYNMNNIRRGYLKAIIEGGKVIKQFIFDKNARILRDYDNPMIIIEYYDNYGNASHFGKHTLFNYKKTHGIDIICYDNTGIDEEFNNDESLDYAEFSNGKSYFKIKRVNGNMEFFDSDFHHWCLSQNEEYPVPETNKFGEIYKYDDNGRLTYCKYMIGSFQPDSNGVMQIVVSGYDEISFNYDNDNNLSSVTTPYGIINYEYDIEGREIYSKTPSYESWHEYDRYGNCTFFKNTDYYKDGIQYEYTYV